jgi:hypothetical protein
MHTHLLELHMERFSQREHIGFGGSILCRERHALQTRRRCHQKQPTTPALGQALAKMVCQIQVHLDIEAQIAPQSLVIHGHKIAGDHRPGVGNHEANISILSGFRERCERIIGGQIQPNSVILDAEGVREFAAQRFERGEPSSHQDQVQSACCQLSREFLSNA